MKLSIIIVHYNAPEDLKACLRSVQTAGKDLDCEIIVVDNASKSPPDAAEVPPKISWIFNKANVGLGAAINQGVAQSRGEVLIFLNQDAELLPDSLKNLQAFFAGEKTELLGPVGGRLLFPSGGIQPSCGPFPNLVNLIWRKLLPPIRRKYYLFRADGGPEQVDWVTGAFLALRRPVFQELGGFDAGFFLYYEDADLCLRAREKGYPAYYLPGAVAYHHHPHAVRAEPDPGLQRIIQASRLLYFKKHRPSWELWTLQKLQRFEKLL